MRKAGRRWGAAREWLCRTKAMGNKANAEFNCSVRPTEDRSQADQPRCSRCGALILGTTTFGPGETIAAPCGHRVALKSVLNA